MEDEDLAVVTSLDQLQSQLIFQFSRLHKIKAVMTEIDVRRKELENKKDIIMNIQECKIGEKALPYISCGRYFPISKEESVRVQDIEQNINSMLRKEAENNKNLGKIRSAMHRNLKDWFNERSNALSFIDFLYYSIGVSTTTTFGDITANNKIIRALISIQLLISVIIVGFFVNSVTRNKT